MRWPTRAELNAARREMTGREWSMLYVQKMPPEPEPRLDPRTGRVLPDKQAHGPSVCTLGVGCDEYGICYARAHGQPEQCGRQ